MDDSQGEKPVKTEAQVREARVNRRAKLSKRMREEMYADLGMVKVKGSDGHTRWE